MRLTGLGKLVVTATIIVLVTAVAIIFYGLISRDSLSDAAIKEIIKYLVVLSIGGTVSAISIVFKPIGAKLKLIVERNPLFSEKQCRILLVGNGRCGKTSIINHIRKFSNWYNEDTTTAFTVHQVSILIGRDDRMCKVAITDYEGQKISELLIDYSTDFFGARGNRQVNAIIFVVDLFPELSNIQTKERLPDEEYVRYSSCSLRQWISERVSDNTEYISKTIIETVFQLSASEASKNLFAVRLLINKSDLLREAILSKLIPDVDESSMEVYARNLYESLISKLQKACQKNNVEDWSVHLVSAKTGEHIRDVFGNIFETYLARTQS